jgi:hypothetical protein
MKIGQIEREICQCGNNAWEVEYAFVGVKITCSVCGQQKFICDSSTKAELKKSKE